MTPQEIHKARQFVFQRMVAEFLGTFAIVFFGCGSIMLSGTLRDPGVLVNIVFGLIVAVMINTLGHISGAHFNPAVSFALFCKKRLELSLMVVYWLAQFIGSIVASWTLLQILMSLNPLPRDSMNKIPPFGVEAFQKTATGGMLPFGAIALVEAVLTFFLMLVIASASKDNRFPRGMAGWTIGGFVALSGMFAGPLTGNSLNPARSLGPAIFAGEKAMSLLPAYFIGPMIGAVIAIFVYDSIAKPESD